MYRGLNYAHTYSRKSTILYTLTFKEVIRIMLSQTYPHYEVQQVQTNNH